MTPKFLQRILHPAPDTTWAPTLAVAYPNPGHSGRRPWGFISTRKTTTRTGRLGLPKRVDEHTALLLTRSVTPEVLASPDWRLANRYLRRDHQEAPTIVAFGVMILGIVLIGQIHANLAGLIAMFIAAVILMLTTAIATYRWDRNRCEAAHARLFNPDTGNRFAIIPLVNDGPLAAFTQLIHDADELALQWQHGHVADTIWDHSIDHLLAVAEDAQHGATISPRLHSYHAANDYITAALEHIGTHGHVEPDDLTP